VLFRWDAPLFFANAELFHQRVLEAVALSPTPVRRIIVSAEPVTSIDVTSADVLAELEQALRASGIELRFAEMKDPVKDVKLLVVRASSAASFINHRRRCRCLPRRALVDGDHELMRVGAEAMQTLAIMITRAWFIFVISWNVTARPASPLPQRGATGTAMRLGFAWIGDDRRSTFCSRGL
jgi:MFS superfamily sulfate permease-like transporter